MNGNKTADNQAEKGDQTPFVESKVFYVISSNAILGGVKKNVVEELKKGLK